MKGLMRWYERYSALLTGSLCLLTVILAASPASAFDDFVGDDFEPAAGPTGGWDAIQTETEFLGLDAKGKVTLIKKNVCVVTKNLLPKHVITKAGTKLTHIHYESDFTPAQRTQANAFADWFFDTANGKAVKQTDATNTTNCYCKALGSLENGGIYNYWINTKPATTGFADDTQPEPKDKAIKGDLLFYKSQYHASILKAKQTPEGIVSYTILWKNNAGGTYQATDVALNTPGRDNLKAPPGQAPTGRWTGMALGWTVNLVYADGTQRKVCRKRE